MPKEHINSTHGYWTQISMTNIRAIMMRLNNMTNDISVSSELTEHPDCRWISIFDTK